MNNLKRANGNGQGQTMSNGQQQRGFTVAQARRYLDAAGYDHRQHSITYHMAPDGLGKTWTIRNMTRAALLEEIGWGSNVTWFTVVSHDGSAGDVTFYAGQLQAETAGVPAGVPAGVSQ